MLHSPLVSTFFGLLYLALSRGTVARVYSNQWAVEVVGGPAVADALASKHGFVNLGSIFGNFYLYSHSKIRKRSVRPARTSQKALRSEPQVSCLSKLLTRPLLDTPVVILWVEQQVVKKRVKRDVPMTIDPPTPKQATPGFYSSCLTNSSNTFCQYTVNDPEWPKMWYLNRGKGLDHNVREAWELGYTGKNVVVTILDDGLEWTHPDIEPNYDPKASFDLNERDADPMPRYEPTNENRHGTRCAGEVAAVLNNTLCIVGIAYHAGIGGIRMLDGEVNDAIEASSLSYNRQHIDIYSASWGPDDNGKTLDGPDRMASLAFQEGVREGRGGKGSIFVWASGNGGRDSDSCNCDGYTNSIYTLSISSATENGRVPWYSEACSSTLATTYSSGSNNDKMIVTTDLHHGCTSFHTGTSASAPLAAGICALTLEANPDLTWRDMQHIVVRTARPEGLTANDWSVNGVGRSVSHSFGYGLMDAGAMVRLARNWTNVSEQHQCRTLYRLSRKGKTIPKESIVKMRMVTDGCFNDPKRKVAYLEHVQSYITLTSRKRGNLLIFLTSPSGTKSTLLPRRNHDTTPDGIRNWAFMTTHSWGEKAEGRWTLEIQNDNLDEAHLLKWELVLYGTDQPVGPYGLEEEDNLSSSSSFSAKFTRPFAYFILNIFSICFGYFVAHLLK
ncbi:Furin [Trichinella nelsoni]|uniref:Furin n=1 Tax=Trichinella nelsoni TaxID=6336 RepID=A0A0V0S5W7_9BILA|nr:Furin [Trichinella nelsoni]